MSNALSTLANSIPIRWGYFMKNGKRQKTMFIGHEKAIYGADGVQLDSKLLNIKDSISDAFSEEKDYAVGDYCIYLNSLYKFTAAKAAGAWDGSKVIPVSVSQELAALNSKHLELANNIAGIRTSGYVDDLNARMYDNFIHFMKYDAHTLNTPRTEGLTSSGTGLVLSFSADLYGVQLCLCQANAAIFTRGKAGSEWHKWSSVQPT